MHKWCWVAYLQLYLLEIFESGQKILSSQEVLKEEFSKYLSSARAWQSWRPLKTRWQIWASIIISCHSWMRFNLLCDVDAFFHAHNMTFLFQEHMLPNRFWTGLSMMPEGWARRKAKFFRQSDCPSTSSPPYFLPKIQFCGKNGDLVITNAVKVRKCSNLDLLSAWLHIILGILYFGAVHLIRLNLVLDVINIRCG